MTDGADPPGENVPKDPQAPLFSRLARAVFAPDVLEDGGKDAPMSPRGRLIFRSVVGLLVVGIAVLLVVTAASR